jgi:hypothetical protein
MEAAGVGAFERTLSGMERSQVKQFINAHGKEKDDRQNLPIPGTDQYDFLRLSGIRQSRLQEKRAVQMDHGVFLEPGDDVAVDVVGDRDRGMAQRLANDLDRDTLHQAEGDKGFLVSLTVRRPIPARSHARSKASWIEF